MRVKNFYKHPFLLSIPLFLFFPIVALTNFFFFLLSNAINNQVVSKWAAVQFWGHKNITFVWEIHEKGPINKNIIVTEFDRDALSQ